MLDLNVYKRDLETKCIEQDERVLGLMSEIQVLRETANITDTQYMATVRKQAAMKQVVA